MFNEAETQIEMLRQATDVSVPAPSGKGDQGDNWWLVCEDTGSILLEDTRRTALEDAIRYYKLKVVSS